LKKKEGIRLVFQSYIICPMKEVSHLAVRWLCMSGLDTGEDGVLFFPPPLLFDKDLPLWNDK
jgi:hypothetical protein